MHKNLILLLFVAAFTNVKAQTTYPSGVTNVIARYNFSTTQSVVTSLPDVSGNAHHADTVKNLVSALSWRNRPGQAMKFNGTSSYAYVKNTPMLTPNAVTMVGLVKADNFFSGFCQFSQIICKGTPGYVPGQYGISFTDDIYDNACGSYDSIHHQLIGYFYNSNNLSQSHPPAGNFINREKWYFVAVAYDGQQAIYYQAVMDSTNHINNLTPFYSSGTVGGSFGVSAQDLSIGKHLNPAFPYWFNGKMDEVVLFNKILNVGEMQVVYDYLWEVFSISPTFTTSTFCQGGRFDLPFVVKAANAFGASNTITVQLSDASGSFASPVIIGIATTNTSGNVSCTIPASTPPGSGYRIRLQASAPMEYSDVLPYNMTITAPSTGPTVSIFANPSTNISIGQLVTFTAIIVNGGASPTYQWKKNGVNIAGATLATYSTNSIVNGDLISVVARTSELCANPDSAASTALQMNVSSSVNSNAGSIQRLSLYPNPNSGSFTVSGSTMTNHIIAYEVRNVLGQLIFKGNLVPANRVINATVELPNTLADGKYLFNTVQQGSRTSQIFTVLRN